MGRNNRDKDFIKENGKVRFRLYKAGKKWLVAGTATVSGLLGGMFIMPHSVQAASQPQAGKVVDKGEVLATQNTATIPAGSAQGSTTTSESTMQSESIAVSQSVSASQSASASEAAKASASNTASQANSTSQSGLSSQSSSTSQLSSASQTVSQNQSTSTSMSTTNSQSLSTTNSDQTANLAKQGVTANKVMAFAANQVSAQAANAGDPSNSSYQQAVTDASNYMGGGLGVGNANDLGLTTNTGTAVGKVSALYDLYVSSGGTMLDADNSARTAMKIFGVVDWFRNQQYYYGFAAASAAYIQGLLGWLDNINSFANDESKSNQIIDYQKYDSTALQGTKGIWGTIIQWGGALSGAIITIIQGWFGDATYAPGIMSYTTPTTNILHDAVDLSVKNLNSLIKILATKIINGIAHEALADIRSIGGANTASVKNPVTGDMLSDYVPKNLGDAVALNAGYTALVKSLGLTGVINSRILNLVYQAIANVARHAIQYNFAIGFQKAVDNFLQTGSIGDISLVTNQTINGYSVQNPALMVGTDQSANLSIVTQANGFAWANKVLAPLVKYAASNALIDASNGKSSPKLEAGLLAQYLLNQGVITQAMFDQITTGAPNQIVDGVTAYVRNPQGVQAVLEGFYTAEYNAVQAGIAQYKANPNISSNDIANATPTYSSPSDPKNPNNDSFYAGKPDATHQYKMADFGNIIHYLQSADATYFGTVDADKVSHDPANRPNGDDISTQPVADFAPSFKASLLGNVPENTAYATTLVRPVYNQGYADEAKRANTAYRAGQKAYQTDLENYIKGTGPMPDAKTSTAAKGTDYTAASDTTAAVTPFLVANTDPKAVATGTAFVDGYGTHNFTEITTVKRQFEVNYVFEDGKGSKDPTYQEITYNKVTDTATGKTTYVMTGTPTIVKAPDVTGYIPDPAEIDWTSDQYKDQLVWSDKPATATITYKVDIPASQAASTSLAASQAGSTSLAASQAASTSLAASQAGSTSLAASQAASTSLAASQAGSTSLAASQAASTSLAASQVGSTSLAASQAASTSLAASQAGSTSLAASQAARARMSMVRTKIVRFCRMRMVVT
jgi:hypothetical protein